MDALKNEVVRIMDALGDGRVYCEECRWCRPLRNLFSLWGLLHDTAIEYSECHWRPPAKRVQFLTRRESMKAENLYEIETPECSRKNARGDCKDFEPKSSGGKG